MEFMAHLSLGGTLACLGLAVLRSRHRRVRDGRQAQLISREAEVISRCPISFGEGLCDPQLLTPHFARDRIVRVENALHSRCLEALQSEALSSRAWMVASYVPFHKQGFTLGFDNVLELAPHCWSLYRNPQWIAWLTTVIGTPLLPAPVRDQSAMSLLCYQRQGDHIQWHYDHNFYLGRHFTVLLSLVNHGASGAQSQSQFQRQVSQGRLQQFDTRENSLIVFEGARVRHRATPAGAGDLRLILSMTYCTVPRNSPTREALRKIKDTAFFGWRALWD